MNPNAVQEMKDAGVNTLLLWMCGITAIREAELIQSLGMRLLVTDHHQPLSELPEAEAVVDPHRLDETAAFRNLCGAGVVLKLIIAMEGGDDTIAMEQYGDLAAIATVADVVELAGENRWIVQQGLRLLANTERPGLLALMEKSGILGKPFSSTTIAFSLAPRINASGRFGSPLTAVKLLLCEDPEEAAGLAEELDRRNQARKEEEAEILQQIAAQVQEHPELLQQRVLVFAGENWHHGVIGIAASRLQERFGKPTILVTIEEGTARGSMRSFGAFSAFRCLQACESVPLAVADIPAPVDFRCPSDQVETFPIRYSLTPGEFSVMPGSRWKPINCFAGRTDAGNIASLSVCSAIRQGNNVPVLPSATLCSATSAAFQRRSPSTVSHVAPWQWTCCCSGQGRRKCIFSRAIPATSDYRKSHRIRGTTSFRHCQGLPEERNAAGEISRRQKHLCAVLPAGTAASGILSGDHASA